MSVLTNIQKTVMPVLMLLATAGSGLCLQDQQTDKREIWDTSLLSKRPAGKTKPLPATSNDALLGITLWRFRPSQPSDDREVRSLIHEEEQSHQWTPERIKADTPLHEGEMIRMSIETARNGYLYVIDSEEYADGSKGDPYLIFPELRIRNGDNHVSAGRVVEIPASDDKPPYFKVRRSRPDHTGELITILISPKPLEELRIEKQRIPLSVEQVAKWNKEWKTSSYRLEATDQVGKPYTLAEKLAGSGEKILNQDDPIPQTMYLVEAKPGKPLLVEIPLSVSSPDRPESP